MSRFAQCPSCSDAVVDPQQFCPRCGTSLDTDSATGTAPRPVRTPTPVPESPSSRDRRSAAARPASGVSRRGSGSSGVGRLSTSGSAERFAPGDLLLDRYRIVGLLGRGGMGEVHRADDLRLGQPVALKFLPAALQGDAERLERFYNEARMAREVSHAAVCRVHDVGDVDGQHFLSMELVDGEDLASLVRRIGRLPGDKAVDVARQLCAGLGAAHDKGVLHRDLKPQNVMLDGRGKVRITDFGLAGLAESILGDDVRSGTPAYMSPEQLAGREVTKKSDIYALGLVLYEVFTGQRAYTGRGLSEIRKQQDAPVPLPSSLVPDMSPEAERAILRCLERDAARRPSGALAVAAMLPGGDPLALALAAGETPSPEMVAAAGRSEGMPPLQAWACVGAVAACLAAVLAFGPPRELIAQLPEVKPPAVLEDRARELLRRLGYEEAPADLAVGYGVDREYLRWASEQAGDPQTRWDGLSTGEPALAYFWYRQGPRPLVSHATSGEVFSFEPPLTVSGMAGVQMDLGGRLIGFYAVPPELEDPMPSSSALDWSPLFAEAQLDPSALRPVEPKWTPPFYCDTRAAWEGSYPLRPEIPLRIEAAAYRGRPVSFMLVSPWTRAWRMQPYVPTAAQKAGQAVFVTLLVLLVCGGGLLARHNLRTGRGDNRGAFRLAAVIAVLLGLEWLLSAHHVAAQNDELGLVARGVGSVLLVASILWVFYLALEPYLRRFWPHTIISWTRLLSGRTRDPLVGRDALVGTVWGAALPLVFYGFDRLQVWLGHAPPRPSIGNLDSLIGPTEILAGILRYPPNAIMLGVSALLILLLFKLLFRREWLAAAALVAVLTLVQALGQRGAGDETPAWLEAAQAAVIMSSFTFLLLRFGLLSAVVGVTFLNTVFSFPIVTDFGSWASGPTTAALLFAAAVVGFAFTASQSGLASEASAPRRG